MNIEKLHDGASLTLTLSESLGSGYAAELEALLKNPGDAGESSILDGVEELTVDIAAVEYISSAGLRILLLLHKKMSAQGKMTIKNASSAAMAIFNIAGFTRFLTIEIIPE